jgi:threonine dehydratase
MRTSVDEMRLVGEDAILAAQQELSAVLPFTVEASAAVGWAAMIAATDHSGAVGLILTGGNVPPPEGTDVSAG